MPYIQLYGLTGVSTVMPLPIQSPSNPGLGDTNAVPGQFWVNTLTQETFVFGGIDDDGDAVWNEMSGNLDLRSIDVTDGPNTINGDTSINNDNNDNTFINTGTSTGTVDIGNFNAGDITIASAGNIEIGTDGNITIGDGTGTNIGIGGSTADFVGLDAVATGTIEVGATTPVRTINIAQVQTTGARTVSISSAGNAAAFADTVSISSGVMNNAGGSQVLNLAAGNLTTGTKTVNINTGDRAAGTHSTHIADGAGSKSIYIGGVDGLTNIEVNAFKATADAAASANASFTANAGIVACTISNLNTASAGTGTITVTNSTIVVGSAVFVNFALAGAEDATMTIEKIRITNNTATITYTNNGAAAIASDCYMSLMVIS